MPTLVEKPEKIQRCTFEVQESDTGFGYRWYGWCEGDKDGEAHKDGDPLILKPEHFIGSTIVEVVPTCPECGVVVRYNKDDGNWYCDNIHHDQQLKISL